MTCKHFTRLSFRLVSPPTIATPNNNLLNNNFVFKEQRVWLARLPPELVRFQPTNFKDNYLHNHRCYKGVDKGGLSPPPVFSWVIFRFLVKLRNLILDSRLHAHDDWYVIYYLCQCNLLILSCLYYK